MSRVTGFEDQNLVSCLAARYLRAVSRGVPVLVRLALPVLRFAFEWTLRLVILAWFFTGPWDSSS